MTLFVLIGWFIVFYVLIGWTRTQLRHFIHSKIIVEINCGKCIHQHVVDELEIFSFSHIVEILGEEDMDDAADEHMNHNEDHERIELTRTPEQSKQLESEEAGNDVHDHVEEHEGAGEGGHSDVKQHVLLD